MLHLANNLAPPEQARQGWSADLGVDPRDRNIGDVDHVGADEDDAPLDNQSRTGFAHDLSDHRLGGVQEPAPGLFSAGADGASFLFLLVAQVLHLGVEGICKRLEFVRGNRAAQVGEPLLFGGQLFGDAVVFLGDGGAFGLDLAGDAAAKGAFGEQPVALDGQDRALHPSRGERFRRAGLGLLRA